ncbi:MAG: hydantoinase/oxoprolinase family protein, partial [Myxococcota bacterium]
MGARERLRIGVDVGGTNTDAVIVQGPKVLAKCKTPTTPAVEDGIAAALASVVTDADVALGAIDLVCIGTTHFTNAFVERRGLEPVGILRVALPAAAALPPLTDWPSELAAHVRGAVSVVRGGYNYDGTLNSPLDEQAVATAARDFRDRGLSSVALSALFAPVNEEMEARAAEIIRTEHPGCRLTLSSHIGRLGLLERENAGIMNASLAGLARATIDGYRSSLSKLGISAPLYVSQNDGTVMSTEFAERYPVLTFASGPTNSMRGAAYLSGLSDALVVDIGGTTADIGVLTRGFPRESATLVDIGGVRTNFRMPDILALGLGGGSEVHLSSESVHVGPRSVGFRLTEEALVYGGSTLTATDIAVASGYASLGDPFLVRHLAPAQVETAVESIHRSLEDGLDRMKVSRGAVPLVLVGGGSILIDRPLAG